MASELDAYIYNWTVKLAAKDAEIATLRAELSLVKGGEPNHPDRAYAMKGWLKTFGFKVFCELKHNEVGFVLSLLQCGDISRGKAAEAIAELLVGNEPPLPQLVDDVFGEDDLPREVVNTLRAALRETREALECCAECIAVDMARMGCCGEGDCGDHKADHQFPVGFRATRDARTVLTKYAALAKEEGNG